LIRETDLKSEFLLDIPQML